MTLDQYLLERDTAGAIQGALADSLASTVTLATVREASSMGWDGAGNKVTELPVPNIVLSLSAQTDPDDHQSGQLHCSVDIEITTDLTEDARAALHYLLRKQVIEWLQCGTAKDAANLTDMMALEIQPAIDSDGFMSTTISFTGVY
jgi:hypothetical protein